MTFGFVPAPFCAGLWGQVVGLLDKAVTRGGNDWGEVAEMLADGRAQLWLALDGNKPVAAMVTRIDGDTFEAWLAGGAVLSGCLPYLEQAIEASKEAGTTNARMTGRKGWARVLKPYGWRTAGEDLVKDWGT